MTISFIIPAVPVAQPRPRACVVAGRAKVYGADRKHAIHDFKASVRIAAKQAHQGAPLEGPLRLYLDFLMPRPQRMIWKKRPMLREPHISKPDLDNLAKSVKDALSGILWRDDSQVFLLRACKMYASGDEAPHVTIELEPMILTDVDLIQAISTVQEPNT